ncbi:hypothetical protein ACLK1V_20385 [Escherichia coli]
MSQVPTISQLLPLPASDDGDPKHKSWDYLYEPDPKALLDDPAASLCRISGLSGRG